MWVNGLDKIAFINTSATASDVLVVNCPNPVALLAFNKAVLLFVDNTNSATLVISSVPPSSTIKLCLFRSSTNQPKKNIFY